MTISNRLTLLTVAAVLASCAISYCSGKRAGERDAKLRQNTHRIAAATPARKKAEGRTIQALARSAAADTVRKVARTRVTIASDSTVSIDGLAPLNVSIPVVSLLKADDAKARADSMTIVSLRAENASLREERDAYKERAELLEPDRCGRKCGIVIGVVGTMAAAIAIDHVRAALERPNHGLRVTALHLQF